MSSFAQNIKVFLSKIDIKGIYIWFIALFFFINALSATSKVNIAVELFFLAALSLVLLLIKKDDHIYDILLDSKMIFPAIYSIIMIYFFSVYPLKDFNFIIFHIDYAQYYTFLMKGVKILLQGSVFGWDSSLLGGYYTIADINNIMVLPALPFMIFGGKAAIHLMLLFFVLAFPALIYYLVKLRTEDERLSVFSFILAMPFMFHYFRNILRVGMMEVFISANLLILSLIAFTHMTKKTRFSGFLLTFTLSLTFYMHFCIFLLSVLFLFLEAAFSENRKEYLAKLFTILGLVFFITVNFNYYFLFHRSYFILDNANYLPIMLGIPNILLLTVNFFTDIFKLIQLSFAPHEINGLAFIALPVIFLMDRNKTGKSSPRKFFLYMVICFLLTYLEIPSLHLLISRVVLILPIFIVLTLAYLLKYAEGRNKLLVAAILICLPIAISPSPDPIPHTNSLKEYNPILMEKILKMDGNMILLEARNTWALLPPGREQNERDTLGKHIESLFAYETGKKFFTYFTEGYHHSIFRGNAIMAGTYHGKQIDDYPVATFNDLMSKWGMRYLILWSKRSTAYFNKYPRYYRKTWEDKNWEIYEYLGADTRSVATSSGKAILQDRDFFEKQVHLINVKAGSEVVVRSNYLGQWKAYFNNKTVVLYDKSGQMAFLAPGGKDTTVILRFPKYTGLSMIALSALFLAFILSWKKII